MTMFDGMTSDQIRQIMHDAQMAYQERLAYEQTVSGERSVRIQEAIQVLTEMIGPEEGPPETESLRGMQRFDDAAIGSNVVLAIRLILQSLEELALTTRDLAENTV